VGAGSVVTQNVPDYALVYGIPARVRGWMCQCGIKLQFVTQGGAEIATCESCGSRYIKQGEMVKPITDE
jgi:UDP-2-acetamido-3-amino-2,3-dideoxy-glucuronate N-acetyltransferase